MDRGNRVRASMPTRPYIFVCMQARGVVPLPNRREQYSHESSVNVCMYTLNPLSLPFSFFPITAVTAYFLQETERATTTTEEKKKKNERKLYRIVGLSDNSTRFNRDLHHLFIYLFIRAIFLFHIALYALEFVHTHKSIYLSTSRYIHVHSFFKFEVSKEEMEQ